ncbi:hydroxymethylglutaryl-CoA lyase, mitochondrial [Leptopilina heterotoma]|uniref:hydroxymethylglutaryl-CoA lyase, mitochondrial n=1 Tax=Leptopilina heterotoma TaxID=63436 RepID=UPI001CA9F5FC|nr:hydroxymethylglutaryl-CoA lyase, mitochondrial [Leptopilina heterotoma]XP_043468278.1 hydroxymethylglutaryl-CoA lyase, mitochondrial [Leptopilina heterotoma]
MFIARQIFLKRINKKYYSDFVKIVEVGPRDGLQNEKKIIPTSIKVDFINKLSETGLQVVEVTSFVSPKWVPQMADNVEVFKGIKKFEGINYPVLVPNVKGLEKAIEVGAKEVSIFGTPSETFSRKNTNCSVTESMSKMKEIINIAKKNNLKIRGYVSCVVACPYEGAIKPFAVASLSSALLELGCYEISLGDTIGVGTPKKVKSLLNEIKEIGDFSKFALHLHDTYGQAIGNIYTGLDYGIRTFDSSVAGLGGCPYAEGATGNVATEDVLYFLSEQGLETGINLEKLTKVGEFISTQLERKNQSKVGNALLSKVKKTKICV